MRNVQFSDVINIHRPFGFCPKVRIMFRLCCSTIYSTLSEKLSTNNSMFPAVGFAVAPICTRS